MRLILPVLLLAATPALAQVTVNQGALDALRGGSAKTPAHHAPARRRPEPHHATTKEEPKPHETATKREPEIPPKPPEHPAATEAARPAEPTLPKVPAGPPVGVSLAPPVTSMPSHPAPPPPPVPVVADAQGAASQMPNGLRVTFGAGSADLNAATEKALHDFADQVRNGDSAVDLVATAPGTRDDPSTPRRLSLARALAARAVLINAGIPSTRIYVRAEGSEIGDGPPDRVDLALHGTTPAPGPNASAAHTAAPAVGAPSGAANGATK